MDAKIVRPGMKYCPYCKQWKLVIKFDNKNLGSNSKCRLCINRRK